MKQAMVASAACLRKFNVYAPTLHAIGPYEQVRALCIAYVGKAWWLRVCSLTSHIAHGLTVLAKSKMARSLTLG